MQPEVELTVTSPAIGRGPVTTGVPWPRGVLPDAGRLVLRDRGGRVVPLQARTLDRWGDGSARWVLFDWIAEAGAGPYRVAPGEPAAGAGVRVEFPHPGTVGVDTGLV